MDASSHSPWKWRSDVQSILQDLRFAARRLVKDRWFTLAAFVALALGIGANSAVFTLVNAVLLRGLPVDNPDRIMWLDTHDVRGRNFGVSLQDFEDWRSASHTLSGMSLVFNGSMNLSADDRAPEQYVGVYISANGFDLIGQRAALGRSFSAEDDRKGAPPVVLLGSSVWKSRYAGDPAIVGKAVRVNALPVTVIGVMPEGLKWPFNSDVWMPMAQLPPAFAQQGRASRFMFAYGRLRDGVTIEQARSEMSSISAQLATEHQDTNKDISAVVTPFNDRVIGRQIRTVFWALMGAVAFVLLIACSNVANLLLARAAARSREIAVRVSLGATRWRIVRQLMVESVLLAVISGIAGLAIAYAGIRWFDGETQNVGKPYWMTFDMDGRVFAFFAVVCVLTGIIFGIAPALHISKTNVNEVLKEGGRSGTGIRARRWTAALIVAELTLTLVLLTGAGFMMRSFLNLYRMDLGIETSRLLTMSIILPARKYPTPQDEVTILRRIDERLSSVGALVGAATTTNQPLQGGAGRQLTIDGKTAAAGDKPTTVTMLSVGPGYFDAVGVRLLRGRTFDPTIDGTPGHEMAIVNQRLVAMYFPGEDPIGKRIQLSDDSPGGRPSAWTTIVGLAPNIRQRSGQDPDPDPVVYVPHLQNPTMGRGMSIIVRGRSEPGQLTAQLRKEIFAVDPDMPLANIRTMDENLAQQRWFVRVFGTMFSLFAAIAIVLATVGLYAVTAYSVTQRTQEIGVRMALGAQPGQVRWLILRRGLIQLAIGLVLGLAGAFGVGKVLQSASVLVQTGPTDIVTMASTSLLLVIVGLTACLWPARQATRLNPVTALRYE
jgi:putative ABC transport system permease protein